MTIILYIIYFTTKYYLSEKWINSKKKNPKYGGLISELIHILLIYFVCEYIITINLDIITFDLNIVLKWILLLIIIFKPVNLNFRIFFNDYAPKENSDTDKTIEGAGALIGNLERLLVTLLLFYQQYSAIGLVFTAKSITRFERISKEPSFAEYYLIGSLYSIICVLVLYGIIIKEVSYFLFIQN